MTSRSTIITMAIGISVIIFAIVITNSVQSQTVMDSLSPPTFSQIKTYGPVWNQVKWVCTSDKDYTLDAAFRGIGEAPMLRISVQGSGTQNFYELTPGNIESFSVGASGGKNIEITRTGTVSGFLTLQTMSDANASCVQRNE